MEKVQPASAADWKTLLVEPIKLGAVVGLYLWVAGAPFGFLHPDNDNWVFFWRLLPLWRLAAFVAASIVGLSAALLTFVWLYRKGERGPGDEVMRSFRRAASPLYFLLAGVVRLIPGAMRLLPIFPLLNKLILPVAVFSSAAFLFMIEAGVLSRRRFRNLDRSISSYKWRWTLAVFVASLLAYGAFMKRCDMVFGYTGGDEAHYLIQAKSLAEDFDRDLVNQLPDYTHTEAYHRAKHLSLKSPPGKAYSYHSIGLPVLLTAGWAVGKVKGALGILLVISSLFAVSMFWIAFKLRRRSEFALGCWGIFCLTTPIIFYACRAYPELPAGLVILLAVWRMTKPESLTSRGWPAMGCLIGFLPWLHIPRLAIPTLLLATWGIVWLLSRRRWKRLLSFAPPLFVSAVLLIALNQHWYGYTWGQAPGATGFEKLDPAAWTGGYYGGPGELFSCWPGLVGGIADRSKGLLASSPAYFIPLTCLLLGLFSRKLKFWRSLWFWTFLAVYIPCFSRVGWYGGACFPSRYLVSVLPLLLFPLATLLSERRDRLLRALLAVLAAFSIWITLRMFLTPSHYYRGVESARWFSPAVQLTALFFPYAGTHSPVYHIEDTFGTLLFVAWVAAAVCMLHRARKKEISWHRSFNITIASILALPLFATAVRRALNYHPYRFVFSGALEHYSTLIGVNRPAFAGLRAAPWGKMAPETIRREVTLELTAIAEKSRTGEVENDECINQKVLAYEPGKDNPDYLSYTRPLKIFPGDYVAGFWLAVDGWSPKNLIILDLQDMATGEVIARRRLRVSDLMEHKRFVRVAVPFSIPRYTKVSLRIYVDAGSPVRVLKYSVEPRCLPEMLSTTAAHVHGQG